MNACMYLFSLSSTATKRHVPPTTNSIPPIKLLTKKHTQRSAFVPCNTEIEVLKKKSNNVGHGRQAGWVTAYLIVIVSFMNAVFSFCSRWEIPCTLLHQSRKKKGPSQFCNGIVDNIKWHELGIIKRKDLSKIDYQERITHIQVGGDIPVDSKQHPLLPQIVWNADWGRGVEKE